MTVLRKQETIRLLLAFDIELKELDKKYPNLERTTIDRGAITVI